MQRPPPASLVVDPQVRQGTAMPAELLSQAAAAVATAIAALSNAGVAPDRIAPAAATAIAALSNAGVAPDQLAPVIAAYRSVGGDSAQLDAALAGRPPTQGKRTIKGRPPGKPLTPTQRRLIEVAGQEKARDFLFQHTVLCQTCLPYRDPGDEVREWARVNGKEHLEIIAGKAMHPELERLVPLGLPFGPKPRLVLMHLNAEALKTSSPEIEVEGSLHAFVKRLKLDTKGRNYATIKDQLARLSASSIRFGTVQEGMAVTVNSQIVTKFELWPEKDDRQRVLWPATIRLSADYYQSLTKHAVPLDEAAIRVLAHSAMALDVYAWLAQRLHRIGEGKPQFIPWTALKEQFGFHYDRIRDFRAVFLHTLRQVKAVYPDARVGEEISASGQPKGMMLENSPPPVPKRMIPVSH